MLRTHWRLWRWGSEAAGGEQKLLCSIGAVVFPHLQKPSCVFSVGEEEEGRAGDWVVLCRGMFCAPRDLGASPQGIPCTPRPQCIPPGRFCAPQDLSASHRGDSVHHKTGRFARCPLSDCLLYLWCDIRDIVYFSYVS